MFEEALIISAGLDYCISHPRHFGCDRRQSFPLSIGVVRIVGQVALVLVTEGILARVNCTQCGHPESHSKAFVAALGKRLMSSALAGLDLREIEPAIL